MLVESSSFYSWLC